jgi:hypothetical protein
MIVIMKIHNIFFDIHFDGHYHESTTQNLKLEFSLYMKNKWRKNVSGGKWNQKESK